MDRNKCVRNGIDMGETPVLYHYYRRQHGRQKYLPAHRGVNYLLACIGAPVWAAKNGNISPLVLSPASGRDSLTDNESYFFAELKRLKLIIDKLKAGEELFIILDEILKGTNSMDKQKRFFCLNQTVHEHGCQWYYRYS